MENCKEREKILNIDYKIENVFGVLLFKTIICAAIAQGYYWVSHFEKPQFTGDPGIITAGIRPSIFAICIIPYTTMEFVNSAAAYLAQVYENYMEEKCLKEIEHLPNDAKKINKIMNLKKNDDTQYIPEKQADIDKEKDVSFECRYWQVCENDNSNVLNDNIRDNFTYDE